MGGETAYTYDANGNIQSQTTYINGQSVTWNYTYNGFAELLTAQDPLQNTTTYKYDSKGNLLTVTTPAPDGTTAASVTTFTPNAYGQTTQIKDALGNITTISYCVLNQTNCPFGLVNYVQDAKGSKTTYAYDGRGNRTSVTDPSSHATLFQYDPMNRIKLITYPTSPVTTKQLHYDSRGRLDYVIDQDNNKTTYSLDDADRLASVTDAATNQTQFGYDTETNITSVTDALQHKTQYSYNYNVGGYLVETTFPAPDNFVETYNPNALGDPTSLTDRNQNNDQFTYDVLERLTQREFNFGSAVNYTYDNNNRLTQVQDPSGTYGFQYDNMGRLTQTTAIYSFLPSRTFTVKYTYDAASNRKTMADAEGGVTTYTYNTLNLLTKVQDFQQQSYVLAYDTLSRRTSMTRPNGLTTAYVYDLVSRLTSVTHKVASTGTVLDGAAYIYDSAGNRKSRTDKRTNLTLSFTYDPIYELKTVKQGTVTTESYTYDAVGNRLSSLGQSPYVNNTYNQLTSTPAATYTYDNNGNLKTKQDSTGTTQYQWVLRIG